MANLKFLKVKQKIRTHFTLSLAALKSSVFLFVILTIALDLIKPMFIYSRELVLADRPLSKSEISNTLTLNAYDKSMGPNSRVSKIPQSTISIAKPYIYLLRGKERKTISSLLPNTTRSDFYLIWVRFSLHELPEKKYYHRLTFIVDLGTKDFVAFDLLPKNVFSKEDVIQSHTVSPEFKFMEIGGKIGEVSSKFTFERLQPIITEFGEGESHFYWTYTCREGERVFPGTRGSFIILEVPKGTKFVDAVMSFEAIISQEYLGNWLPKEIRTDSYSERWNLSDAQLLE